MRHRGSWLAFAIVILLAAVALVAGGRLIDPTRDRPADVTPTATETRAVVVVRTDPTRAVAMPPSATPVPEPLVLTPSATPVPPTVPPSPAATFTPKPATPTAATQKG